MIILLSDTRLKSAQLIAEQLRKNIEVNIDLLQHAKKITISLGVTQAKDNGDDAKPRFKHIDNVLYQAKTTRKNLVVTSNELTNDS